MEFRTVSSENDTESCASMVGLHGETFEAIDLLNATWLYLHTRLDRDYCTHDTSTNTYKFQDSDC